MCDRDDLSVFIRRPEAEAVVDRWNGDRRLRYEAFAREFAGWQQAVAGHDYWELDRFVRADVWYLLELGTSGPTPILLEQDGWCSCGQLRYRHVECGDFLRRHLPAVARQSEPYFDNPGPGPESVSAGRSM